MSSKQLFLLQPRLTAQNYGALRDHRVLPAPPFPWVHSPPRRRSCTSLADWCARTNTPMIGTAAHTPRPLATVYR